LKLFQFFATGNDRPLLSDRQEIDTIYRRNRRLILLAITVGYGVAYTCRLGLSVVKKPLLDNGIFTAGELGDIGAALLYAYALGKLTNGFLADHANLKRFFAFGVLVSALLNLLMGRTELFWIWIVIWGLNGWFQGFGAPTGAVSLANWFSTGERGRYYGIWSTGHAIGEGLTFVGSAALVSFFGWQAGFWGPGLICIFVAGAIYLAMQDRPQTLGLPAVADWKRDHPANPPESKTDTKKTGKIQLTMLKMPAVWVLGLASASMYMTRYAINSWGFLYLQEEKGYSLLESGGLLGINTLAGIAGCLAYGFISDKLFRARRPPVTLIFGVFEVLALIVIFYAPAGHTALVTGAFILYGFMLSGLLAALGGLFAIDIVPKRAAGAAMGFIGVFSYIGAGIQDKISGVLIDRGTTVVDGVNHYDFSTAVIFWIGSSVLSMILAATLWRVRVSD
jgi:OPA family sugar phosphate sensor protein UhpC-like MFS transporter